MAPFLLGIVFASLIEPLVKKLDTGYKIDRKPAVIFILTTLVLLVLTITGLSLIAFYQEMQRLIPRVPELVNRIFLFIQGWLDYLSKYYPLHEHSVRNFIFPAETVNQVFRSIILGVINFLPHFPQVLFAIGLGGITAYFFSRDKKNISKVFYQMFPKNWQIAIVEIKEEVMSSVAVFIRVESTLACITTIITTLVFSLLGTPGAFAYGFLTGIFDFIPVIGPGLIYIPSVIISLLFKEYNQALCLVIAYFLLLFLRQIIEFKLIGENLNLHPILSVFVVYLGLHFFGFAGIFLGPLLIITLRSFYRVLYSIEN